MHARKLCLALAGLTLSLVPNALADTITLSSTSLPTLTLGPSNDTVSFDAASVTAAAPGTISLQSGSFYLGNSPIPDQVIAFYFNDIITLNGVTNTVSIFGSDNVTSSADILTIFAGTPVNFGAYTLTLDSSSYTGTDIGQSLPMTLSADVSTTPTPEPGTFILFGTGLASGLFLLRRQQTLLPAS